MPKLVHPPQRSSSCSLIRGGTVPERRAHVTLDDNRLKLSGETVEVIQIVLNPGNLAPLLVVERAVLGVHNRRASSSARIFPGPLSSVAMVHFPDVFDVRRRIGQKLESSA
jgi:hypothetical protein